MQAEVLAERYQLQEPIGRGGMATIYRGRDLRMDRTVAIKVLRDAYSTDPKFVTRFQREAKAASSLQHPNIVQVYDYGQSGGNYFIVMELIDGTDLRRYLRPRGVLAVNRAMLIARDVALGLGAAHRRGIVHRDVKPQNILVGRDGSIKLTDFGIASVYKGPDDERLTTTGMTLGTVQYYAPEQAQGEVVTPAADVYALGIVMYEMLTGRTPFDGDTPVAVAMQHIQDAPTPPRQFNPEIPPALEEVILRCLEKVPEMRFRDGSTLARALEALGEETLQTGGSTELMADNGPRPPIPPRPQPPGSTARPVSSPGNMMPAEGMPSSGPDQPNRPSQPGIGNGFNPHAGQAPGSSTIAQAGDRTVANYHPQQQPQQPLYPQPAFGMQAPGVSGMGGSGTTRPFRAGQLVHEPQTTRFAGVVTVLILVATLVLLGFSVYLASDLGFLPFLKGNPAITPTATVPGQVQVPDLVGKSYQDAKTIAQNAGFKLQVISGPNNGIVKDQSPKASELAPAGSTIQVNLETVKPKLKVPDNLVGKPLASVQKILSDNGIAFVVQTDPNRPQDYRYGPNTVTTVTPPSGTELQDGQQVILYVTNRTDINQPTPVPTQAPTQAPTQTPTQAPTQAPTATPKPKPTPTATPKATPTAASSLPGL